jgi:hypothetical protein
MDLARVVPGGIGSLGQRKTVIVVPQFVVHDLQFVKVVIAPQDGDADLPSAEIPIDIECLGIL